MTDERYEELKEKYGRLGCCVAVSVKHPESTANWLDMLTEMCMLLPGSSEYMDEFSERLKNGTS